MPFHVKMSIRKIAAVAHPLKPAAVKEIPKLRSWLKKRNIMLLPKEKMREADAVISLGGDGTILSIAHQAAALGIPVFGTNMGRLGFLTVTELNRLYSSLEQWLGKKWATSERLLLEVLGSRLKEPQMALNDVVIRLKYGNRVTSISASINKEKLGQFVGDGVIVATTTGSTAYSLSAQGPIVHPDVEGMILTPICAHSFSQRPMVFPSHYVVDLLLSDPREKGGVQLCLDGQRTVSLECGDRVQVRASPYKLKLVQNPSVSYFSVLRKKLNWGDR